MSAFTGPVARAEVLPAHQVPAGTKITSDNRLIVGNGRKRAEALAKQRHNSSDDAEGTP